jgi:hypothetical protein
MADQFKAEKLIAKKGFSTILSGNKVTDISIGESEISCVYNLDRKYKYNLKFTKTHNGNIDFKLSFPSLIYLLLIGALIGFRFMDTMGFFGVILGVLIFYIINLLVKNYLQSKVWYRINDNWKEVVE